MKYIRDRNNDVGMQDQSNHKLLLTLEWKNAIHSNDWCLVLGF